jgi:small subunit ribosomal protein S1
MDGAGEVSAGDVSADDVSADDAREPEFAQLLEESLEKARPLRAGDRLRGVVQRIDERHAFLDYGGPREAVIDTQELRDPDGNLKVAIGERIDVTVAEVGEQLIVHRIARKFRDRSVLKQAFASASTVEGKVTGTNKGGFEVQVSGFRAFCPISQIDRTYCSDPQVFVGQTLPFRIIEYKEGGRRVVVSRARRSGDPRQAAGR